MSARLWVNTLDKPPHEAKETCCITPLPLEDAAKISALADLFPQQSPEELISILLNHALDELPPQTQASTHPHHRTER